MHNLPSIPTVMDGDRTYQTKHLKLGVPVLNINWPLRVLLGEAGVTPSLSDMC